MRSGATEQGWAQAAARPGCSRTTTHTSDILHLSQKAVPRSDGSPPHAVSFDRVGPNRKDRPAGSRETQKSAGQRKGKSKPGEGGPMGPRSARLGGQLNSRT